MKYLLIVVLLFLFSCNNKKVNKCFLSKYKIETKEHNCGIYHITLDNIRLPISVPLYHRYNVGDSLVVKRCKGLITIII